MDSEQVLDSRQACFAIYQSNNYFNSQAIWVFSGLLGSLLATSSKKNNDVINGIAGVSALGYLSFMTLKERLTDLFSDAQTLLVTTAVPDQHESSDRDNEQLCFSYIQTENGGQWLRYSVRAVPGSGSQDESGHYAGKSENSSQPDLLPWTICTSQPFVNRDCDGGGDGDPGREARHTYNHNCPLCNHRPCNKVGNARVIAQEPKPDCQHLLGGSGAGCGAFGGCITSSELIAPCGCKFGGPLFCTCYPYGTCIKSLAIATGVGCGGFLLGGVCSVGSDFPWISCSQI